MRINYIMVPRELIYCTTMNDKRIIIYSYFASKRGLDDTVGFSCNSVVRWCGHSVDYHRNKINDQVSNLISKLMDCGYLIFDKNIISDTFVEAIINQEKFDISTSFAMIYLDELNKLREFKKYTKDVKKMTPAILLLVLSYLRVNMLRRQKKYIGNLSDKPEFCYRMYVDVEKDIGISSRYISRAVKILDEMDLIVSEEMPRYKDEYNNWHTDVTLFANKYRRESGGDSLDVIYDYAQEIEWGKEYILKKKYINKKFDQLNT